MTTHAVFDVTVPFNWNGEIVRFDAWPNHAFGRYNYTTTDLMHEVEYDLVPAGPFVSIILRTLDGLRPNPRGLTPVATVWKDGELHVAVPESMRPRIVPEALLLLVVWAEGSGFALAGSS